jgi:hypothetical protein
MVGGCSQGHIRSMTQEPSSFFAFSRFFPDTVVSGLFLYQAART